MGVEVVVVQHGDKVRSIGDPGLTEAGVRQAVAVGEWLADQYPTIEAIVASPLRRAQETAAQIAKSVGVSVTTDDRVRERMNWDDDATMGLDEFLDEWHRATVDRSYQPIVGDSSDEAARRFLEAVTDLEGVEGVVIVVAHGGVTVDALRTIAGDAAVVGENPGLIANGVANCAITRLHVEAGTVSIADYPSTDHLA